MFSQNDVARVIKNSISLGTFSEEAEIKKLFDSGMDKKFTTYFVKSTADEQRQELSRPQPKPEEKEFPPSSMNFNVF